MRVTHLELYQFRNFLVLNQSFKGRVIGLMGDNGHGKTNILEALYCLSTGDSWRTSSLSELMLINTQNSSLQGSFFSESDETLKLILERSGAHTARMRYFVNGVPRTKKVFMQQSACIVFAPEDMHAITGSPSERRVMVDRLLSRVDVQYGYHLRTYQQVVTRRNKVLQQLREGLVDNTVLTYWTEQMIIYGVAIYGARARFFGQLPQDEAYKVAYLPQLPDVMYGLSAQELTVRYAAHVAHNQHKEVLSGTSHYGPHKDDVQFFYENRNISMFGSRGQQRSALTWYLCRQYDYLIASLGIVPYVLLDDVFSELDQPHRQLILDYFREAQIFISGCERRYFEQGFDELLEVQQGRLTLV